MNTNIFSAVKQLIAEQGAEVLNDSRRVGGYLADMAAKEPKPQRATLVKCLVNGYHRELQAADEADRRRCKQRLAQKLHDEEGLDLTLCNDTLDLLGTALWGETAPPQEEDTQPTRKPRRKETETQARPALPEQNIPPKPAASPATGTAASQAGSDKAVEIQENKQEAQPGKKNILYETPLWLKILLTIVFVFLLLAACASIPDVLTMDSLFLRILLIILVMIAFLCLIIKFWRKPKK